MVKIMEYAISLGATDIASFIVAGPMVDPDGKRTLKAICCDTHTDGNIQATLISSDLFEETKQEGTEYDVLATFNNWCTFYDDTSRTAEIRAKKIQIIRSWNSNYLLRWFYIVVDDYNEQYSRVMTY